MNVLNLERLFHKITEVTTIADVGFHIIEKGYLNPIYKTQTEVLGLERWKAEHQRNPAYVKGIICIVSIGEQHQFTKEEMDICSRLIEM